MALDITNTFTAGEAQIAEFQRLPVPDELASQVLVDSRPAISMLTILFVDALS